MMPKKTVLRRRKPPQPTLTSVHLPLDLVAEILCCLPVKQLIQLRCVCKSWNSLISGDSTFAKKHLRMSTSRQDRHHLIINSIDSSPDLVLLHSPISTIFSSRYATMSSYSLTGFLNEGKFDNHVSTCDGILCYSIGESRALLCNPSIQKFKLLPPLNFPHVQISYTLGYDRFISNYKIIAVNILSSRIEVNVHILGTNYWRRIQDFPGPDLILRAKPGIFVNDSINWLTYDSTCCAMFIVSLDLEKESYQKLSLPMSDEQFRTSFMTLGTLRGCLSLFSDRTEFCDVWIMKEYGNEKSWTKLFSVPRMMKAWGFCSYTKVLYISKDDQVLMEILLSGKYKLVVYDSINKTTEFHEYQNNICGDMEPEIYVESMISPF